MEPKHVYGWSFVCRMLCSNTESSSVPFWPTANALVTADPFSCWIANCLCMASVILFFFFSYLRFSVFSSCLFCSCSYSLIKCPPICHDASNISSSSQFVPLHFVVTSWNLYDFYLYFLFAIAPFRHPLDFPFNLICLTAKFAQQIRAYSKCYISHFSWR